MITNALTNVKVLKLIKKCVLCFVLILCSGHQFWFTLIFVNARLNHSTLEDNRKHKKPINLIRK